ncbi:hypothetical protein J437_LFUL010231 [Ladona fulva]|uniref:Protein kinase domain-containing protein n=1 Tax=Ladona fulva TaxID=123851 RepID=A0A8K0KB06_LADFU|nr:hypothetical protein J437_LFUL010231 [Ladona fulva]
MVNSFPPRGLFRNSSHTAGKFAVVRRVTHRETGVAYAAKFIRKRRRAEDQRLGIMHEAAVLLAAEGCERIVRLHQVYETTTEMVLVLELGKVAELTRRRVGAGPWQETGEWDGVVDILAEPSSSAELCVRGESPRATV